MEEGGKEAEARHKDLSKVLFLFDVDGTLTLSRKEAAEEMKNFLTDLKGKALTGFVGGSDIAKQKEQLGDECISLFKYCFPQNGLHFYKDGEEVSSESYIQEVGEKLHQEIVNYAMKKMSKIDLPLKRGNFIEFREAMINISPIGRSCSSEERKAFVEYEKTHKVREELVSKLKAKFDSKNMSFSIGGEISIDCFPKGWNKTYCLKHLAKEDIAEIHFFGDMTSEGGNDHEIAKDSRVVSHTVTSPEDTMRQVEEVISKYK